MSPWIWVVIAAVVILLIGLIAWAVTRRENRRLRGRFGPEYDRVMQDTDSRRGTRSELRAREQRRESIELRDLPDATRERYRAAWDSTQAEFVDRPREAVRDADALVTGVMTERGYPMDDFDQRAADISADHPKLVQDYREAHDVWEASGANRASTEDLRRAMVHYRSLFEELLGEPAASGQARAMPGQDESMSGPAQATG